MSGFVAYLGGITESAIAIPAQRMFFWDGVLKCLDRLSISKPERNRIVAAWTHDRSRTAATSRTK
jgi:hypothetical protein